MRSFRANVWFYHWSTSSDVSFWRHESRDAQPSSRYGLVFCHSQCDGVWIEASEINRLFVDTRQRSPHVPRPLTSSRWRRLVNWPTPWTTTVRGSSLNRRRAYLKLKSLTARELLAWRLVSVLVERELDALRFVFYNNLGVMEREPSLYVIMATDSNLTTRRDVLVAHSVWYRRECLVGSARSRWPSWNSWLYTV